MMNSKKRLARFIGIIFLAIGVFIMIRGAISFFRFFYSPFDNDHFMFPPLNFISMFGGAPFIVIGMILIFYSAMSEGSSYQPQMTNTNQTYYNRTEIPPQDKTFTRQVKEEVNNKDDKVIFCPKCLYRNPLDAKYCCNCGDKLQKSRTCMNCGNENDGNAKYCTKCGSRLL